MGALHRDAMEVFTRTERRGRPPRPEGRGFHAPGWLRCGPAGATSFPPRPEGRGFSEDLDEPGYHLPFRRQRHASYASAGDEPEGYAYFGLVSCDDAADGIGAIWQ